MSILTKIFSAGAGDLVKSVGGVIDNLHTSEEEKLEAAQKVISVKNSLLEYNLMQMVIDTCMMKEMLVGKNTF